MKKLTLILFALILSSKLICQTNYVIPFTNQPYWIDFSTNELKSFEKVPLQSYNKSKGLYGAEVFYYSIGITSPVQFNKSDSLKFVIKMNHGEDPSNFMALYKFDINNKRKYREFKAASRSSWDGGITQTVQGLNGLEYKNTGEDIYEIILPELEIGEYGFGHQKGFFNFGIK